MKEISKKFGVLAGGALLVVGSVMTWISVDVGFQAFSSRGTETTEGKLTLAAGIVLLVIGLVAASGRIDGRAISYLAAATAVFGSVVLFLEFLDVLDRVAEADGTGATAAVGAGVWIAAFGAIIALAATAWTAVAESRS